MCNKIIRNYQMYVQIDLLRQNTYMLSHVFAIVYSLPCEKTTTLFTQNAVYHPDILQSKKEMA